MKAYFGNRTILGEAVVSFFQGELKPLPNYNEIINHSPSGFEWGYSGSGPAQLALAILYDVLDDKEKALNLYQKFKFECISTLGKEWVLWEDDILKWVKNVTVS